VTPLSGIQSSIESGDYTADIASIGSTLRTLRHKGRDLVRAFDENEVRPRYLGATLVPWPNRVVDGRYSFAGENQQLAITEPERGHALHGLAVWLDWAVVEQTGDSVTLAVTVPPQSGYPHRVQVSVRYRLDEQGLECAMTATNTGESPAPFGTAAHPYLVAGDGLIDDWTLLLPAAEVLEVDERLSPVALVPVPEKLDFRTERPIGDTRMDHAFTALERGADGRAVVHATAPSGTGVALSWGPEYSWVQVFTSDLPDPGLNRRAIAVEAMTCPPDAFNSGTDLLILQPGASFTGSWRISAL
jgi:aldose 1-epimerase